LIGFPLKHSEIGMYGPEIEFAERGAPPGPAGADRAAAAAPVDKVGLLSSLDKFKFKFPGF
jgi:hypothetical protein